MEDNKELKNKIAVTVITLIAFFCTMFSGTISFLDSFAREVGSNWVTQYVFKMPSVAEFFQFLLAISPYFVFVVYILMFYTARKARIFIPVIFGLLALSGIWTLVDVIIDSAKDAYIVLSLVVAIGRIAVFALATAFAVFKPNKWILSLALVFEFVAFFCNLPKTIETVQYYLGFNNQFFAFVYPLNTVCLVLLSAALLVFVLSNDFKAKK